MSNYQAVTRERHAQKRWLRQSSYAFAAAETVAPLTAIELPKAALALPLGFIKQGEDFIPVAVLGLKPGINLFVTPDWRWIGHYIPAVFRAYPFRLGQTADNKQILCIDEDSNRVSDGPSGEAFFTEEGQPVQVLVDMLSFLSQINQNRLGTVVACSALKKHTLIQPWPPTVTSETDEKPVTGLFQIDEAALRTLPGDALHELVQTGALIVAYSQLLSMQHLPQLNQLAEAHAKHAAQALAAQNKTASGASDLDFFSKNGTISFTGLL